MIQDIDRRYLLARGWTSTELDDRFWKDPLAPQRRPLIVYMAVREQMRRDKGTLLMVWEGWEAAKHMGLVGELMEPLAARGKELEEQVAEPAGSTELSPAHPSVHKMAKAYLSRHHWRRDKVDGLWSRPGDLLWVPMWDAVRLQLLAATNRDVVRMLKWVCADEGQEVSDEQVDDAIEGAMVSVGFGGLEAKRGPAG